jgi:hypothetical protein
VNAVLLRSGELIQQELTKFLLVRFAITNERSLRAPHELLTKMPASGNAPTLIAPVPEYKAFRRTCCFCIPTRAGVIFFGLLGLLGGTAVAATGIYNLVHQNLKGSRIALLIQIISYILLALVSVLGLIGAISRRIVCIRAFFVILILHLLASIGTGIYAIRLTFLDGPEYSSQCESNSEDPGVIKSCKQAFTLLKAFVVIIYIGAWLIQIWASVVVFKYMRQLSDEDKARKALKASETW